MRNTYRKIGGSASKIIFLSAVVFFIFSFNSSSKNIQNVQTVTAKEILGNPNYLAICYGGYRKNTREIQPTIQEIKEDLKILAALKIKVIRTYNVHFKEATTVLEAITELKKEDPSFEMYVMLGAWIDCKNAWTTLAPIHTEESDRNAVEIETAVALATTYPEIVKIISVGNEAMVQWATSYYVHPKIILKWVNHLQALKQSKKLPASLWITSSDDFASWGGGDKSYQTQDLEALIHAVDYVSMHTYPFHNSHYNPDFWTVPTTENSLTALQKTTAALDRAQHFAEKQYNAVKSYVHGISPNKPIHIGETGWASVSDGFYGTDGSKAADEYKQALYYKSMRAWTAKEGISCFFFEAFDETWKDSGNQNGSENHFGLFTVDGKAKYALWDEVANKAFANLERDGHPVVATFSGDAAVVKRTVLAPPSKTK